MCRLRFCVKCSTGAAAPWVSLPTRCCALGFVWVTVFPRPWWVFGCSTWTGWPTLPAARGMLCHFIGAWSVGGGQQQSSSTYSHCPLSCLCPRRTTRWPCTSSSTGGTSVSPTWGSLSTWPWTTGSPTSSGSPTRTSSTTRSPSSTESRWRTGWSACIRTEPSSTASGNVFSEWIIYRVRKDDQLPSIMLVLCSYMLIGCCSLFWNPHTTSCSLENQMYVNPLLKIVPDKCGVSHCFCDICSKQQNPGVLLTFTFFTHETIYLWCI